MPPEMGLLPSNLASGRMYSTSSPLACFQDVTQPPNRCTCRNVYALLGLQGGHSELLGQECQ